MASSAEPQNEGRHAYRFSPLPQSETHDDDEEVLSIAVDSRAPEYYCLDDDNNENEGDSRYERTCERSQDIFGITVFIVLILLPLYRRLGAPTQDPVPPIFTINSMSLSNFTASNGGVGATWDANFTIINTNVSSIYFRTIDFTLFYKTNPEDVLSSASSYPFYLDKGDYVELQLNFQRNTDSNNNNYNDNSNIQSLAQEQLWRR
ncbi:hypothetical protein PIB30_002629 [Stylosanthes scabra]|uniref:Late embryogenesis abundant protein LEA-2 subgroup domain-containing protein n=1 Tax=Stylosanthes scabra TaxID=79078 RepID=A0ABU6Q2V4_9FABA|nr:hypothetical protein [Stylosanthes scabra]